MGCNEELKKWKKESFFKTNIVTPSNMMKSVEGGEGGGG